MAEQYLCVSISINQTQAGFLNLSENLSNTFILLEQGSGSCTDADADGYFAEVNCGTELDCLDSDPGINPGVCDIKGDGIDQDCDGRDRKKGKPCPGGGDDGGGDTGGTEGKATTCSDGTDNDGLFDCDDPDCRKNKSFR